MSEEKKHPDEVAIEFARKNLDLSKNLNDQGYFGPSPNEADPRANFRPGDETIPTRKEYYDWVCRWVEAHDGKIDNKQMDADRRKEIHAKIIAERRARGDMSGLILEYW